MNKFLLFLITSLSTINLYAISIPVKCPATAQCVGEAPNQRCFGIGEYTEFFDTYIPPKEAARVEGDYKYLASVGVAQSPQKTMCIYFYDDGYSYPNYPTLVLTGKKEYHFGADISSGGWQGTSNQAVCWHENTNKCVMNISSIH